VRPSFEIRCLHSRAFHFKRVLQLKDGIAGQPPVVDLRERPKGSRPLLTCIHILKNAQLEFTAIGRIVQGLAKHGSSYGYDTSVLFLGDGPLEAMMKAEDIPTSIVHWEANRHDLVGALRAWSWLRRHPADIVHLHYGGLAVRAVCRLAGIKVVVQHIHSRILENDETSVSRLSFRMANAIIANSRSVADCLPASRTHVVYAGIDIAPLPPATAISAGPLKLGVLARLIPLKNIEAVVNATALLAERGIEVRTEIAGSGPSEESLRNLTSRLGMNERVTFLGWRRDIAELLTSWDLLVIPSREEGFGLSALDAMAAARTVVASRVGGLCEVVDDGITGLLVPSGDVTALACCIADLARDRERLILMGNEGWKRARRQFSADLMTRRVTELYDQLLDRRSRLGRQSARGEAGI